MLEMSLISGGCFCTSLAAVFLANWSIGQEQAPVGTAAGTAVATAPAVTKSNMWSLSATAFGYFVPGDRDYVQPTFTADRSWLHLEARYNYENLETGSAWLGCNFHWGDKLFFEATPMVGGIFGDTTGLALGYKLSVTWLRLELYSEGEYLQDLGDSVNNFFYNWSELTVSPVNWLRLGVAEQRTIAYRTERDVQRGFLVGFSYRNVNLTACVFNPDARRPILVLGAGVQF